MSWLRGLKRGTARIVGEVGAGRGGLWGVGVPGDELGGDVAGREAILARAGLLCGGQQRRRIIGRALAELGVAGGECGAQTKNY